MHPGDCSSHPSIIAIPFRIPSAELAPRYIRQAISDPNSVPLVRDPNCVHVEAPLSPILEGGGFFEIEPVKEEAVL